MPDPQGLDVHDVQVSHQTAIGVGGRPLRSYVVSYGIGVHGPFTDSIPDTGDAVADGAAIQSSIQQRVQLLRAVVQPTVTG